MKYLLLLSMLLSCSNLFYVKQEDITLPPPQPPSSPTPPKLRDAPLKLEEDKGIAV